MRDVHVTARWCIPIIILLLVAGCAKRDVTVQLSAEDRFQRGMRFFEEEDYIKAIDEFRIVTMQFGGSEYADDAQFHLGESYFRRREYILAASEYQTLVNTMTGSEWIPAAQFQLSMSYVNLSPEYYLDQDYTINAIDELQTFVEFFPTHEKVPEAERMIRELTEKLAKKEYENARLYMRLEYYRAATRYFDIVMERYHDTPFAELSHIGKVEALIQRGRYEEADEAVRQFLRQYPDSPHRGRAENFQRRIASELRSLQSTAGGSQAGEESIPEERS